MATKIVGCGVCGPGEADNYLEGTLQSFRRLCDEILIVTNNVTSKEKALLAEYGVKTYEDNRDWGLHQRSIKEQLHAALSRFNPDWVLALDMDEQVDNFVDRQELNKLALSNQVAWHFYMVDLWGAEDRYAPDMCFWKVQFYKYQPKYGFKFYSAGFDPGQVPEWAATHAGYAGALIRHYGLISEKARQKRVARYAKYDAKQLQLPKVYYAALEQAVHTQPFSELELHQAVVKDIAGLPQIERVINTHNMAKFHYLRRQKDHVIIDVPDSALQDTLRRGGFDYVSEVHTEPLDMAKVPIVEEAPEAVVPDSEFKCKVCGFEGNTSRSLATHKRFTKHE